MKKNILILLTIILLTTSCSRYEELNNLSIISNIAITKSNNNYIVTMQEITPKANDNKIKYEYSYRTSTSKSINKSFSNIINHSPKKIYLEQVQNIIIENKNRDSIMKEFVKYNNKDLNKKASLVLSNNDINSIMKINSNYKYINSVLKEHIITLKKIKKKTRKKERIYLPLIVKYNKELVFKKNVYLQLYSSDS